MVNIPTIYSDLVDGLLLLFIVIPTVRHTVLPYIYIYYVCACIVRIGIGLSPPDLVSSHLSQNTSRTHLPILPSRSPGQPLAKRPAQKDVFNLRSSGIVRAPAVTPLQGDSQWSQYPAWAPNTTCRWARFRPLMSNGWVASWRTVPLRRREGMTS